MPELHLNSSFAKPEKISRAYSNKIWLYIFLTGWDDMRTAVIFLTFGAGLSPILMTLTDTISTDTIYAMTAAMLLANLLFHDYGAGAVM